MSNRHVSNVYISISVTSCEKTDTMKYWALLSTFERRSLIHMTRTLAATPKIGTQQFVFFWKKTHQNKQKRLLFTKGKMIKGHKYEYAGTW